MHPYSSQTYKPQKDRANPKTHNISAAPTLPTLLVMDDGAENIPVPIMRPVLLFHVSITCNYEHETAGGRPGV